MSVVATKKLSKKVLPEPTAEQLADFKNESTDHLPTLGDKTAVAQYAHYLGVTQVNVRQVAEAGWTGALPTYRLGRNACYSKAETRNWLMSRRLDKPKGKK